MYKFSAPMPYTIEDINKLLDINNQVNKSAITSLYACVPRGCEVFTGFEQSRNFFIENNNWDYWKSLIEHTLNKNCDFIYLLNSPKPLNIDTPDFPKQLDKLNLLLIELKKLGVNKLRIAAIQLIEYINKYYPEFQIYASTSFEYKTIWEYQNFFELIPYVKQIVPSHDINKNFKLLSNIKKRYPDIEIEIMVNEGCLQGCPNRVFHEMINIDKEPYFNDDENLSAIYCINFCNSVLQRFPIQSLVIGNHIFPWELKEYEKTGITNFKFVGRDGYSIEFEYYLKSYKVYLKSIDDIKNTKDCDLAVFFNHLRNNPVLKQLTVKDCKKYLPDIKHFVKKGHFCASRCGVQCRYCYNCAEKIEKVFQKEIKRKEKLPHYIPVCKMSGA